MIQLTECPRDAMQGIHEFIPTETKIKYINQVLKVGFDTVDFGSFVSPKAIPQMADTAKVLKGLDLSETKSKLLAIVANERGANDACQFDEIFYLGFPFSISDTFQQRNTNASIQESFERVKNIQNLCLKHQKALLIYISMGFGNPYGDEYNADIVAKWVGKLSEIEIKNIAFADTVGVSNPENIKLLYDEVVPNFPEIDFGIHLHSNPISATEKINAAYNLGCKKFDSAILGIGGCPMAKDELVGNLATETLLDFLKNKHENLNIDLDEFEKAKELAFEIMR